MQLSIIILNYKTKKITIDCINSIYSASPKVEFEIVVVDNASDDGSVKEIQRNFKNKNLVLVTNKKNYGFSKGNNVGIKKAKGEYILLLNSDTLVKKDSVEKMYQFAIKHPEAGVVGPRLLNKDGTVQYSVFHFPTLLRTARQYWLGEKKLLDKYAPKGNTPKSVDAVVGAAFLITPQAREKVGLLDENYFMYFEDIDYCRKVKKVGLMVYYLPNAEITHLHGQSGKDITDNANQWKRMIPSAKTYYGELGYYIQWFIMRTGQFLGISK